MIYYADPAADQDGVDVILTGGPAGLPQTLRVPRSALAERKIRIIRNGGYEHYQSAGTVPRGAGAGPAVFRWTMRTKIAE